MPKAIPIGITAYAVRQAAAAIDSGQPHGFGEPTRYEAIVGDRRYPPKALIGMAAKIGLGLDLGSDDFSGGEARGQANYYLRELGFEVVSKDRAVGEDWTDDEARAAIASYFEMLEKGQRGETFVKKRFLETLMSRTHGRSRQSCEFKLRNISAVMTAMGLDYLSGYVPADNFQQRLADLVAEHLEQDNPARAAVEHSLNRVPPTGAPTALSRADIEEPPPPPAEAPKAKRAPQVRLVVDAAKRDAANKALGKAGEAFVVELERAELARVGRSDLADRIRWVADVDGDGLGYDILSYAPTGESLYIEVKTTNGPKTAPFYVTANEVAVSAAHAAKYKLYRVFQFSKGPRFFVAAGSLVTMFRLDPIAWRASPQAASTEEAPPDNR